MTIRNKTVLGASMIGTLFLASGCDVDKTQDGNLPDVNVAYESGQVPKYKVVKTQEGKMPNVDVDVKGGNMPEFEVETADVNIGTKEVEVSVPDVDVSMKEKKMSIPDIDITMPDDGENDK